MRWMVSAVVMLSVLRAYNKFTFVEDNGQNNVCLFIDSCSCRKVKRCDEFVSPDAQV
jgi:hypothetical protein